jgi:uncharacterized repeat protein (TIGR01451 family)
VRELNRNSNILMRTRIGLIILATSIGLALTVIVAAAAGPTDFDASCKEGPQFAKTGDLITYTIIAMNTGDSVTGVVLSDALPSEVTLVNCTYYTQSLGTAIPSCDQNHVWEADFDPGDRITTTIVVSVTGSAKQHPMINRAYLSWDSYQKEMVYTTTLNPQTTTYLPLILYQQDPYEPNDTREQAYGPLVSNQAYTSYIYTEFDQRDYYYLTLPSTGSITVDLIVPDCCDYDLYLYDSPTGSYVAASNYMGKGLDEHIDYGAGQAGTVYYILVYSFYQDHSSEDPYVLNATFP